MSDENGGAPDALWLFYGGGVTVSVQGTYSARSSGPARPGPAPG